MSRRNRGGSVVPPPPRRDALPRPQPDALARLLLLGARRLRLARIRDTLRASLWFLPALALSAAAVLSISTIALDRHLGTGESVPLGMMADAETARGLLSLISSWMLTFMGLAFTMTIVVLQLASGQFSPRVLGTLLRDRYSKLAMGFFIGTFAYSFMVMREVRSGVGPEFVPAVSLAVAFALVLVCLGVFIRYVNHVAQSIRAGSVIITVAQETRRVFDQMYPPRSEERTGADWRPYRTIPSPVGGLLRSYDAEALVGLATRLGAVIEIVPRVGEFIPRGAPLVRVVGASIDEVVRADISSLISIGRERTMHQDPAFGFRQLVDIAERALSPGVNDPTTAVQVIDQIHDLLRDLLGREFPTGSHTDAGGDVRLVIPTADWEDFLRLGIEEIRHYGAESLQVERRLAVMLDDLWEAAGEKERPAIEHQLGRLQVTTRHHFPESGDVEDRPFDDRRREDPRA